MVGWKVHIVFLKIDELNYVLFVLYCVVLFFSMYGTEKLTH